MNTKFIRLGLTAAGAAGVWVTSWLSVKCHEKAKDETDKKKKFKYYIPAAVSGVATTACILGSHRVSSKEIAAMSAGCAYLAANRDKIVEKVREKYGEQEAADIRKEATFETKKEQKELHQKAHEIVERTPKGYVKFVDYYSGREFCSTLEVVKHAIKMLNWRFHNGEYVCLNDLYEGIGIRITQFGEDYGWPANEDYYDYNLDEPISIDITEGLDENGEKMYMIDIITTPMDCWMEL